MAKTRKQTRTARVVRRILVVNQNWDSDLGEWMDGEFEHWGDDEVVFRGTDDEVATYLDTHVGESTEGRN